MPYTDIGYKMLDFLRMVFILEFLERFFGQTSEELWHIAQGFPRARALWPDQESFARTLQSAVDTGLVIAYPTLVGYGYSLVVH